MTFNYNKFKELLKIGQRAEEEAIKKINKPIIKRQDDNNYKNILYDFETDDNIKYEVKLDRASKRTNNAFIEFRDGRGLPSGITTTTADKHIIIAIDIYYLIDTSILKEIIKKCNIAITGDGTKGYILPVQILKNNSIIL
jgi:hypothetical protein